MHRPTRGLGCGVVAMAMLLGACADDRPTTSEWTRTWEAARAGMPSFDTLLSGGRDRCDELVGELRATKDRLEPAPSEALDAAVDAWLDHAEGIAFDCPGDPAQLTERYAELDVLAAEVDAGLAAGS